MRPRQSWSICTLLLVTAVGCVSAAGCSASDPPGNDRPIGNAGAGGLAGSSAGTSSAGASGMMMPSQMGNGPPGAQSGAAGLGGGGGSMSIAGAGGLFSSAGGVGGSSLNHSGAGGAGTTMGGSPGAGMSGISGMSGVAGMSGMNVEMGRLMGITAAHNTVRAAVVDSNTPLPPLVWSDKLAQYAQQWADELATTSCSSPHHRTSQELQAVGYGENLAVFTSSAGGSTAQQAVSAWASEKTCYTFGKLMTTDQCDTACYTALHSDGCGHYTQIVWRTSTSVGCGVATCQNGKEDIWICNYSPAGNYVGQNPY